MTPTEEQTRFIESPDQAAACIASPGSGKTTTLAATVPRLLSQGAGGPVPEVLNRGMAVLTFGRYDAAHLQAMVNQRLADVPNAPQPRVSTVHSLCYTLVKQFMRDTKGFERFLDDRGNLRVASPSTRLRYLRQALSECQIGLTQTGEVAQSDMETWSKKIDYFKSSGSLPTDGLEADVYQRFQEFMGSAGWLDFGDLLLYAEHALKRGVIAPYSTWVVDEAQDLSIQQWKVLSLMMKPGHVLRLTGDPFQSIYSFRGAVGNPLEILRSVWTRVDEYTLTLNFRSSRRIIAAAERTFKRGMHTNREDEGIVKTIRFDSLENQAEAIAAMLSSYHTRDFKSYPWNEMCVISRIHAGLVLIQAAFEEWKIPHRMREKPFFKQPEVMDVMAWLQMTLPKVRNMKPYGTIQGRCHPILRVWRRPVSGLTKEWERLFWQQEGSVWERLHNVHGVPGGEASPGAKYPARFRQPLSKLIANLERVASCPDAMNQVLCVLNEVGYGDYHNQHSDSGHDNLLQLARLAAKAGTVPELMTLAAQNTRMQEAKDAVALLTMHASKGLEYAVTVVANLTSGVSPHYKGDEEEERRLFYVAQTRAKDVLILTSAPFDEKRREPSPYLEGV